jgi:hypothetical protein
MLKRAHDTPRLIYNRLHAYTTDTAYRIRTPNADPKKLVYCFLNALTALSAELEGRYYGGGVLELIPSEIERLLIPVPQSVRPKLRELDTTVKNNDAATVLQQQNEKILGAIGLSKNDQDRLLKAWLRLKNRRQRVTENYSSSITNSGGLMNAKAKIHQRDVICQQVSGQDLHDFSGLTR